MRLVLAAGSWQRWNSLRILWGETISRIARHERDHSRFLPRCCCRSCRRRRTRPTAPTASAQQAARGPVRSGQDEVRRVREGPGQDRRDTRADFLVDGQREHLRVRWSQAGRAAARTNYPGSSLPSPRRRDPPLNASARVHPPASPCCQVIRSLVTDLWHRRISAQGMYALKSSDL